MDEQTRERNEDGHDREAPGLLDGIGFAAAGLAVSGVFSLPAGTLPAGSAARGVCEWAVTAVVGSTALICGKAFAYAYAAGVTAVASEGGEGAGHARRIAAPGSRAPGLRGGSRGVGGAGDGVLPVGARVRRVTRLAA